MAIIDTVKLLKTLRADPSDTFVFARAASPGEWAVSGAFAYAHLDPTGLTGKAGAEFRVGFLGLTSFGRSTLVQVVEAGPQDSDYAVRLLAQQLIDRFGAPDLATAIPAAEEEVEFAKELAQHPAGQLIAVTRSVEDGTVREVFRALAPLATGGPIQIRSLSESDVNEVP
jgi:hypothetical protein